jgi:hypothetical protein
MTASGIITTNMNTSNSPRFWTRFHQWIHQHHTAVYVIAALGLIVSASLIATIVLYQRPVATPAAVAPQPVKKPAPPVVYYSPLTGNKVATATAEKQAVTAIMIENSPSARPQSGLKDAGIIYEAIAEGGITRYLALYQQEKPALIGPVRSVRMYFVDWLAPYDPSIAHVGGSFYALQEVRNGSYRDIDQFFNGNYYWRSTDRYAPHNVYTSFKNLDALNASKGYTSSSFTGITRADPAPATSPTATSIAINFSGPLYNTTYTYDKKNNRYLRFLAGEPHLDRENGQITPSVVVAMHVDMKLVLEDGYREQITTTGSGIATIFQNGTAINVTWHKASRKGQLTFTNSKGEDVPLVRGQTWIAAVPNGSGSVSWR